MRDYYITLEETKRDIDSERINSIRVAHEEGIEQKKREAVYNMKSEGFDIKIIAKCLGISEAKVEELLK